VTGPGQHEHGVPFDPDAERAIAEHVRFELDDAAYLLGALEVEEREAFERHLRACPICQDRIAEFGDLPGVLARADVSAWEPEPPPDTLLPRLLRQVAASRRRRARRLVAVAAAAACLLGLLATGGVLGWQRAHQPQTLTMQPVGPNAAGVHATVQLIRSGSSTRVKLACGYPGGSSAYPDHSYTSYQLVIFNRKGEKVDLGSWTPQPDEDVQITRNSPWPRQSIDRIEISDDHDRTVLRLRL
jgi:hypothetical protein